jgi:CubicO group peptidase (beta-lactamase class C family)
MLAIINKSSLDFKPGEKFQHSNLGFTLCAIAMENATGKSFANILHEKIFKPLKMNATGIERT